MKTGLTKKQKVTEVFYNAKDTLAEVYTRDTNLKKRMRKYEEKYPALCRLTDDDGQGGLRLNLTLTPFTVIKSSGIIYIQSSERKVNSL